MEVGEQVGLLNTLMGIPVLAGLTFPDKIARGLDVDPAIWEDTLITTSAGQEQVLNHMSEPKVGMTLKVTIDSPAMLHFMISFLRITEGRSNGFRIRDWTDFLVGYSRHVPGGTEVPEQFAVADGTQTAFQLTKTYTIGSHSNVRRITRPRQDAGLPVKIYFGSTLQTSGFTINYETGVVTFASAPSDGTVLKWSGSFDIPVHFDSPRNALSMRVLQIGETASWRLLSIIE